LKKRARLDELLVSRGLAPTVEHARALILAGRVAVGGRREDKAGARPPLEAVVEVAESRRRFVSRGGEKLEAALEGFGVDVAGKVALDVGTSTGGFADCLLRRGARRVYAVDTGYGKIDARLRDDPRVVLRERTNARRLTREDVPEEVGIAAADVSFISLKTILPAIAPFVAPGGTVIALVKPQFEARRSEVPGGGVVRDAEVHERVLREVASAGEAAGLSAQGFCASPIRGARGNIEFLLAFEKR
jgi:23S rRNA (cytidine1920-2'-O)/16S rRNA (cytidine1409-2'-O)-methyltransferase